MILNRYVTLGLLKFRPRPIDYRGWQDNENWAKAITAKIDRERRRRWLEAGRKSNVYPIGVRQ